MASHPVSPVPLETDPHKLSYDVGWDFILQLVGSGKGMYDDLGGVEAFVRRMRSDEPLT